MDPDHPVVEKNAQRIKANVLNKYDADDSEVEDICYVFNYILNQEKKDFIDLKYKKSIARFFLVDDINSVRQSKYRLAFFYAIR